MSLTVAVHSGDTTETVPASLTAHDGSLVVECNLLPGPLTAAMQANQEYGWTLYGTDGLPVMSVDDVGIVLSDPWPDGWDVTIRQRISMVETVNVGPSSVTVGLPWVTLGGL